jgi:uncharacterized protein YidB (DUF937 family)
MKVAQNPQVRQLVTSLVGHLSGGGSASRSAGGNAGGNASGSDGVNAGVSAGASPAAQPDNGAKMAGLMDNLSNSGWSEQVKSWIGTGDNQPISPQAVAKAVGPDQLQAAAKDAGMTSEQAADTLSNVLPQVVDQASPAGKPPGSGDFDKIFSQVFGTGQQQQ